MPASCMPSSVVHASELSVPPATGCAWRGRSQTGDLWSDRVADQEHPVAPRICGSSDPHSTVSPVPEPHKHTQNTHSHACHNKSNSPSLPCDLHVRAPRLRLTRLNRNRRERANQHVLQRGASRVATAAAATAAVSPPRSTRCRSQVGERPGGCATCRGSASTAQPARFCAAAA